MRDTIKGFTFGILASVLIVALVGVSDEISTAVDGYVLADSKVEEKFELPKYLVMHRTKRDYSEYDPERGPDGERLKWNYHQEFANTEKDIKWILERYVIHPDNLVGIWDISESPQIQAESWEEEVVVPEKIVERKYTERRWKLIPSTEYKK